MVFQPECIWPVEVCAIGSSLIPTLNGGTDTASDDGGIKSDGLSEAMMFLIVQGPLLLFADAANDLKTRGILGNLRGLLQQTQMLVQALGASKLSNVAQQLFGRQVTEGILDAEAS